MPRLIASGPRTVPLVLHGVGFGLYPPAVSCIDGTVRFVNGRLVERREP